MPKNKSKVQSIELSSLPELITFNPETHHDVKGIELPEHEKVQVVSQLEKLKNIVLYELEQEHQSIPLKWRAVGDAMIKLREYIESCKTSLGFTSFKSWYGDQKFGTRQIGYSQATKYMTIAANFDSAKIAYDASKNCSLSSIAADVNVLVGKAKTKVSDDVKPSPKKKVSAGEISDTLESSENSSVTSLQAVLDFIASSDMDILEILMDAIDAKMINSGQLQQIGI